MILDYPTNDNKRKHIKMSSSNTSPDYLKNRLASNILAKRIEDFWHRKGHTNVKAWVESVAQMNGDKYYVVRSNVEFRVPEKE